MPTPRSARLSLPLLVALLALAAGCARAPVPAAAPAPLAAAPAPLAAAAPRSTTERLHLLVINGGGRPPINYQSHLLHVRQLLDMAAQAGIPAERIHVFSSDGDDPGADLAVRAGAGRDDLWQLAGTPLQQSLRPTLFASSSLDGQPLQPATRAGLDAWFAGPAQDLRDGDTLLLYVTDHGERNPDDLDDNTITLWGKDEKLSVSGLRLLLDRLDPGVRVVALMSQCFSGSFYGITGSRAGADGLPGGATCGYFSSTRNRPAYGCYPENLGRENVGHSFDFFQGLARTGSFAEAHMLTLVEDATPDVPLRTSDQFLHSLLLNEASRRGVPLWVVVDEMLTLAWRDRSRWEPQIRLLDRIGDAFGYFSPRSLAELREQKQRLPKISTHLRNVSLAWKAALADANRAHLRRFLADEPAWKERLDGEALRRLDPTGLEALGSELAAALAVHAARDREADARRNALHRRGEDAAAASYRMEVRLAAVLRMRMVLIDVAGRTWLAHGAGDAERNAHAALLACEDAIRLPAGIEIPALTAHEPFPPFDEDVDRATAALPAWMGIRFRGVPDEQRKTLGVGPGAAQVLTVFPESPAAAAGLAVGDIVLGPPDAPFSEFREVRAWTMLSEIGVARPLAVLRGGQPLAVNLIPASYPVQWPSLPGPPKVGDAAPPLQVTAYRGDPASVAGRPHILFFWATWCLPCKAALPRLLEIEAATGMPVVAVTDEPRETLDAFFAQVEAFPQIVAIDDLRQTHQAWGVSGTPTFAFVGADGRVRQLTVGFSPEKGLPLPEPPAAK